MNLFNVFLGWLFRTGGGLDAGGYNYAALYLLERRWWAIDWKKKPCLLEWGKQGEYGRCGSVEEFRF